MSRVGPASRVSRVESMRDMFTYACMCACIHSRVSVNMQAPLYLCTSTHIVHRHRSTSKCQPVVEEEAMAVTYNILVGFLDSNGRCSRS